MFIISEYLNPENIPQDQAESLFQQHAEWFTKHFNLGHFVLVGLTLIFLRPASCCLT
ncbi:hypothetical protein I3700191H1_17510 [Megasphaera massiliensis]